MIAIKTWVMSLAATPVATVASLLRSKRQDTKQVPSAEVQLWENEGGNPAPSSDTRATVVTTGGA